MNNRYDELLEKEAALKRKLDAERNRLQLQENRANTKERKARTRLLIQKGALLDKYFDISHLSVEDTEKFLKYFSSYIQKYTPEKYKNTSDITPT